MLETQLYVYKYFEKYPVDGSRPGSKTLCTKVGLSKNLRTRDKDILRNLSRILNVDVESALLYTYSAPKEELLVIEHRLKGQLSPYKSFDTAFFPGATEFFSCNPTTLSEYVQNSCECSPDLWVLQDNIFADEGFFRIRELLKVEYPLSWVQDQLLAKEL